jgi:hypothetical protein
MLYSDSIGIMYIERFRALHPQAHQSPSALHALPLRMATSILCFLNDNRLPQSQEYLPGITQTAYSCLS